MNKEKTKSDFLQLLLQNNEDEIKKFLISKGKKPKPFCPIQFIKKEDELKDNKE